MKIEIGYAKKGEMDFGALSKKSREGTIKVDREWWIKYCNKRLEWELMHNTLWSKIPWAKREKLNKELAKGSDNIKKDSPNFDKFIEKLREDVRIAAIKNGIIFPMGTDAINKKIDKFVKKYKDSTNK